MRKPLSQKTRFEVFKRDSFRCAYCGKTPPDVILELDHIIPVSKGGGNTASNLVTACYACNRGKGSGSLAEAIPSIEKRLGALKEKAAQIKAYRKLIKRMRENEKESIEYVCAIFEKEFPNHEVSEGFKRHSLANFIKELKIDEVEDAMYLATNRIPDSADRCLKYFCGICWRKIRRERGEDV